MVKAFLALHDLAAFLALRDPWDELAERDPSPFLTHAWLASWWAACGTGQAVAAVLHGPRDEVLAGALLRRGPGGALHAAANAFSDDWGAVARDPASRRTLWRALADTRSPALVLANLRDDDDRAAAASALMAAGRRVHQQPRHASPFIRLDGSLDEVLAARSANLRSQVRRRTRALESMGRLALTTTTDGANVATAFEAFVAVEGSGWKDRAGTALAADAAARRLYEGFAHRAAERGWLRIHLLTLDDRVLAGDFGIVIGDQAFMLKTGYDVEHADRSPGLVLRAEVIRHLIGEGVRGYDLLGGADDYKLRWTDETRQRTTVRGFAGIAGLAPEAWSRAGRPAAVRTRDLVRSAADAVRSHGAGAGAGSS